ncbi:MAG: 50S ribosomal protein L3 [Alphaproteobacteria bacterium]|nr:50S ribosomal protein L3 [Alphaproteobacteria bacterium]MDA8005075.1 50S ribosomal protein L3 [Alphaproteobacteria bacterium]MDA8012491.1 50S ribosomal protein L3 [Alphaproteobacteria bacterium]
MTSIYREDGVRVPATVLRVPECRVVSVRTRERDGYLAVQLGAGRKKHPKMPEVGHYAKAGVAPAERLAEFRLDSEEALLSVGREVTAAHFVSGQHVDVSGTTVGKGFAGVMKRYGFGGGRATHGTSVSHRAHGSTGQHQDPGRVFKNKKMAGHMGSRHRTVMSLRVLRTDAGEGLIFVEGSVPGARDGWVLVRDAVKRSLPADAPFPTAEVKEDSDGAAVKESDESSETKGDNEGAAVNESNESSETKAAEGAVEQPAVTESEKSEADGEGEGDKKAAAANESAVTETDDNEGAAANESIDTKTDDNEGAVDVSAESAVTKTDDKGGAVNESVESDDDKKEAGK